MASSKNGSETKPPSALEKLHSEFQASGGKPPTKKEQLELIQAWRTAENKRKAAEENLAKSQKAVSDAAAAIIRRCSGKSNVVMPDDKQTYVPMCRGETIFFRRLGGDEPLELG